MNAPTPANTIAQQLFAEGRPRREVVEALCKAGKPRNLAHAMATYVWKRHFKGQRNAARQVVDGQRRKAVFILLPADTQRVLEEEAAARGVSVSALGARLIEIIEGAEMWDAVLDGEMRRLGE